MPGTRSSSGPDGRVFGVSAVIWGLGLTVLSLFSVPDVEGPAMMRLPNIDKAVHFTFYFTWTLLIGLALGGGLREDANLERKTLIRIAIGTVLYGMVLELLQGGMGYGRTPEFADFLANAIGAVAAGLVLDRYYPWLRALKWRR